MLEAYHLREEGDQLAYEKIENSEVVPELDLALLLRCTNMSNHVEAMRMFQQEIQSAPGHQASRDCGWRVGSIRDFSLLHKLLTRRMIGY